MIPFSFKNKDNKYRLIRFTIYAFDVKEFSLYFHIFEVRTYLLF